MLRIFVGFDDRQWISFTTLASSIYKTAKRPVAITPLILETLPITRRGLTPFTFSRFLVPWLCDYSGPAIFMDADMLLVSDITELEEEIKEEVAVSVVQSLEQYEQSSFMLFNCDHPSHKKLTPDVVQETAMNLHGLEWVEKDEVGSLEPKWNQLIGYQQVDLNEGNLHFTMGIPAFKETSTSEGASLWQRSAKMAMSAIPWVEIMGPSVHVIEIDGVKFPKYVWDFEKNQPKPEHLNLVKSHIIENRTPSKPSK